MSDYDLITKGRDTMIALMHSDPTTSKTILDLLDLIEAKENDNALLRETFSNYESGVFKVLFEYDGISQGAKDTLFSNIAKLEIGR